VTPRDALQELALAVNHTGYDAGVEELYAREIASFDSRDILAACRQLARTSQWWPKLVELRLEIGRQREYRINLTANADDPGQGFIKCKSCEDTGYLFRQCSGDDQRTCGRTKDRQDIKNPKTGNYSHTIGTCRYPHNYVEECECRLRRLAHANARQMQSGDR
jgi:hypothetical protein